jgi:hypothetical protein
VKFRAGFLATLILSSALGCGSRPQVAPINSANTLKLYEGLPHPGYEAKAFEEEKKKPTLELAGYPFYREPLELNEANRAELKNLIDDPGFLQPYSGEKKCGGFHPDYAVEWTSEGSKYYYLLCFGCGEAKLIGPNGNAVYNIDPSARQRLKTFLQPHQKNRPSSKGAGP